MAVAHLRVEDAEIEAEVVLRKSLTPSTKAGGGTSRL